MWTVLTCRLFDNIFHRHGWTGWWPNPPLPLPPSTFIDELVDALWRYSPVYRRGKGARGRYGRRKYSILYILEVIWCSYPIYRTRPNIDLHRLQAHLRVTGGSLSFAAVHCVRLFTEGENYWKEQQQEMLIWSIRLLTLFFSTNW